MTQALRRAPAETDAHSSPTQDAPVDQQYCLLSDGSILTVHGYAHPAGHIVGELSYLPDPSGPYQLLGMPYRKAYQSRGRGLTELERPRTRARTETFFDSAHPFLAKSIVPTGTVDATYTHTAATDAAAAKVRLAHAMAQRFLGELTDRFEIGLTGSHALSTANHLPTDFHDVDVVLRGSARDAAAAAATLQDRSRACPDHRLREHGKSWRIRLQTSDGIFCPFFVYRDAAESPLASLRSITEIEASVTLRAIIVDDVNGAFLPTVLHCLVVGSSSPTVEPGKVMPVVISHMRSRGDFSAGDTALVTGSLIEIDTGGTRMAALSVIDGNRSRLLTPPWLPF